MFKALVHVFTSMDNINIINVLHLKLMDIAYGLILYLNFISFSTLADLFFLKGHCHGHFLAFLVKWHQNCN